MRITNYILCDGDQLDTVSDLKFQLWLRGLSFTESDDGEVIRLDYEDITYIIVKNSECVKHYISGEVRDLKFIVTGTTRFPYARSGYVGNVEVRP